MPISRARFSTVYWGMQGPTPSPFRALFGEDPVRRNPSSRTSFRESKRTVEYAPVDIECERPLFALIDGHYDCQDLRILVDIHFFEVHALLPQEVPGLPSSLRSPPWCTFGHVPAPRDPPRSEHGGLLHWGRMLDRDSGNSYHDSDLPFGQEMVSRKALSSTASTSCGMPQSNASNSPADSTIGFCAGKWRRILPTRA